MRHPNGTLLTPEQAGELYAKQKALYASELRAFYEHYWPCKACKPKIECEEGQRLNDDYIVAARSAEIFMMDSKAERRQALIAVPDRLRDRIAKRVQELWDSRPDGVEGQA